MFVSVSIDKEMEKHQKLIMDKLEQWLIRLRVSTGCSSREPGLDPAWPLTAVQLHPVVGDPTSSSGLHKHYTYVLCSCTCRPNTRQRNTNKNLKLIVGCRKGTGTIKPSIQGCLNGCQRQRTPVSRRQSPKDEQLSPWGYRGYRFKLLLECLSEILLHRHGPVGLGHQEEALTHTSCPCSGSSLEVLI